MFYTANFLYFAQYFSIEVPTVPSVFAHSIGIILSSSMYLYRAPGTLLK